jgi:hypothetical protein
MDHSYNSYGAEVKLSERRAFEIAIKEKKKRAKPYLWGLSCDGAKTECEGWKITLRTTTKSFMA